ncbi:MAG TPA: hypothetical protein VI588_02640 [Candidatus Gracilibacteria bacterium]|nr:hypothetical protein [Candidatus Gracilibacteria bacterium]
MADQDDKKNVLSYQNVEINPKTQAELNQPLKAGQIDPADQSFLQTLVDKIEKKEINLYQPDSLLNKPVYEKLDPAAQGTADYDAFRLLSKLREIHNLWKAGLADTYQFQYLVHEIRLLKESIEKLGGDIFVI